MPVCQALWKCQTKQNYCCLLRCMPRRGCGRLLKILFSVTDLDSTVLPPLIPYPSPLFPITHKWRVSLSHFLFPPRAHYNQCLRNISGQNRDEGWFYQSHPEEELILCLNSAQALHQQGLESEIGLEMAWCQPPVLDWFLQAVSTKTLHEAWRILVFLIFCKHRWLLRWANTTSSQASYQA